MSKPGSTPATDATPATGAGPALETPTKGDSGSWLLKLAGPTIRKKLGARYDPEELLKLVRAICNGEDLPDDKVLDLAEMFAFWMRSQGWTLGLKVFETYLGIDTPPPGSLKLPPEELTKYKSVVDGVATKHWPVIQKAVEDRVHDTTGALFPRRRDTGEAITQTIYNADNDAILIEPKPSPLRAGGTEVIYYESQERPKIEASEIGATLGGFGVYSRVTVKSTPLAEKQWLIEIQEWKCWAYDDADFNARNEPNTQYLPIRIADFFGPEWMQANVFQVAEERFGIKRECLEHPMAYDKYMRQLAYNVYERTSVVSGEQVTYFPQPFRLIFTEWDFYQVTPNGAPHEFTVTEAAAAGGG